MGDPLCDEGVEAPDGGEYTVLAQPRGFPVLGRGLIAMILLRHQYEVRVDLWPRRRGRKPIWRAVVTGPEAELLCHHLVGVIENGQWMPGESDPPPFQRIDDAK